jgi:hypothetical protein
MLVNKELNKSLDKYDTSLLTSSKFTAGWSGESWFRKDNNGTPWQVYVDNNGTFKFRPEIDNFWREDRTMTYNTFSELFL